MFAIKHLQHISNKKLYSMRHANCIFVIILLTISSGMLRAQNGVSDRINEELDRAPSIAKLEQAAAKASANGDYYTAMKFYDRVIRADSSLASAWKGYAESAVKINALPLAQSAYQYMLDHDMNKDGSVLLDFAAMQFLRGNYEGAKGLYHQFLHEEPASATAQMMEEAQKGLENSDWALSVADNTDLETPVTPLDTLSVNTTRFSEYSPLMVGDTLWFSSYRFPFKNDRHNPERYLVKVLNATIQDEVLTAEPATFNQENRHTAHVTFNEKGDVMYYSECDFINDAEIRCELYMRQRQGNTWGPAVKLPESINMPGYTSTGASVGKVPGEDKEVLYFVSDRPGGRGMRDIWYSVIGPDGFAAPLNLPLNTTGNDVTPFYHSNTGTLYYSTDGLQTLGGFDIYKSQGYGTKWSEPVHMGVPLNSSYNDAYFTLTPNSHTAFLSSNRRGDHNSSEEACCYDIFKADLVKPQMLAITFNRLTGDSLSATTMRLVEITPNGPGEEIKVKVAGTNFAFPLQPGKKYMLIADKPHFKSDTIVFDTPKTIWKDVLIKKLYLTPAEVNLLVTVYDKETKQPIQGAKARYYDIGQLLPGGTFATGKGGSPLEMLEQTRPADNRFEYPLQFDHRYKVVVSKPGYTIDSTDIVSTEGLDGNTTIERKLYITRGLSFVAFTTNMQNRDTLYGVRYELVEIGGENRRDQYLSPLGKNYETTVNYDRRYMIKATKDGFSRDSVEFSTANLERIDFQKIVRELRLKPLILEAYLPIRLFFDNDYPDPRTMATTTPRDYRPTYVEYYNRKDDFIAKYTAGMTGKELQIATDTLDYFFEKDVRAGWEGLMAFSEVLYEMMTRGDTIVLTLKGFASPRAATNYNLNLTARRVSSVLNHFMIFDGGIYKKFVQNGQITIVQEPNGESKSPRGISDVISKERESIYSVPASRERRLEIIGVQVNNQQKLAKIQK
ncbi:MAG: PD40 domain-containing protein [Lewinellaceae bacterium]|nr:PD40 domain-containing protein [Lewinellaceae bacterium]